MMQAALAPARCDRRPAGAGPARRQLLAAALGAALTGGPGQGGAQTAAAGGRMVADFEPLAALWLGYDPGHEPFTVALARALQPHVPLKMLVRDAAAEAAARALLQAQGLQAAPVRIVQQPQALFFMRDAAVFARAPGGALTVVDFRWSHYGWATWCRRRHDGDAAAAARCASTDDPGPNELGGHLATATGATLWRSTLAMEGGGVEVNGQGLLMANEALWVSRNPGLSRAAIERELLHLPGITKVIWLPAGLAQDPLHRATIVGRHVAWGTGGHTDEFVRFADARTVLLAWPDEAEAAAHPVARLNLLRMQRNLAVLVRSSDQRGRPLRVLKVPLPRVIERRVFLSAAADMAVSSQWSAESFAAREQRRQGDWVMQVATASYLNFVVANDVVVLPDYLPHGTPRALQDRVQQALHTAFAGRQLRFVDAIGANWVGGGAHCATLSEPALVS